MDTHYLRGMCYIQCLLKQVTANSSSRVFPARQAANGGSSKNKNRVLGELCELLNIIKCHRSSPVPWKVGAPRLPLHTCCSWGVASSKLFLLSRGPQRCGGLAGWPQRLSISFGMGLCLCCWSHPQPPGWVGGSVRSKSLSLAIRRSEWFWVSPSTKHCFQAPTWHSSSWCWNSSNLFKWLLSSEEGILFLQGSLVSEALGCIANIQNKLLFLYLRKEGSLYSILRIQWLMRRFLEMQVP